MLGQRSTVPVKSSTYDLLTQGLSTKHTPSFEIRKQRWGCINSYSNLVNMVQGLCAQDKQVFHTVPQPHTVAHPGVREDLPCSWPREMPPHHHHSCQTSAQRPTGASFQNTNPRVVAASVHLSPFLFLTGTRTAIGCGRVALLARRSSSIALRPGFALFTTEHGM